MQWYPFPFSCSRSYIWIYILLVNPFDINKPLFRIIERFKSSVTNSSSELNFVKIRAESGRTFSKNPGKIRVESGQKSRYLPYNTSISVFIRVTLYSAFFCCLANSSITLWTCTESQKSGQNHKKSGVITESQKSGQNHKNSGVIRAIFHKRPDLSGRLSNTGELTSLCWPQQQLTWRLQDQWFLRHCSTAGLGSNAGGTYVSSIGTSSWRGVLQK